MNVQCSRGLAHVLAVPFPLSLCAGMEAFDFIERGGSADLMLLDIQMPVKSGLEVMWDFCMAPPQFPVVR